MKDAIFKITRDVNGIQITSKGFSVHEIFGLLFAEMIKLSSTMQKVFTDENKLEVIKIDNKEPVKKRGRGRPPQVNLSFVDFFSS